MNEFEEVALHAKALVDSDPASWAPLVMNVLLLPLMPYVLEAKRGRVLLKVTAVDDDWLAAVAALPHLSPEGLGVLSEALARRGWVSVAEAIEFVQREVVHAQSRAAAADEQHARRPGAAMLLARAEQALPGTIDRFGKGAKTFRHVSHGRFNLSPKWAAWVYTERGAGAPARHSAGGQTQ